MVKAKREMRRVRDIGEGGRGEGGVGGGKIGKARLKEESVFRNKNEYEKVRRGLGR